MRRASISVTGEAQWDDVGQAWVNDFGAKKWRGAEQPPDMQWETCLWDVCRWLGEFDCLWMQRRPRHEIEVVPAEGALGRLAGDLGVSMDDSDLDLESECEDEAVGGGGFVLRGDITGWSHGQKGKRVVTKVDFGAVRNLFGVSVVGVLDEGLGGVGTGGPVAAHGMRGAVQVGPALPLTPRRTSPVGGEGQSAVVAVEDVDMVGTGLGGVAPAPAEMDGGGRCDCRVALTGVRREMVREIRKVREEMIGELALLLAERGLGTWEEGRK